MTDRCPHCGFQPPAFRDAFCPECRGALDEPPFDPSSYQTQRQAPLTLSDIVGAEGLTWDDLASEITFGGRLLVYHYCVSIGILTFMRTSKIHLVRGGESVVSKGWQYTLLSLAVGWWGFPWGFIYTPLAIIKNLGGGTDVTDTLTGYLPQGRRTRRRPTNRPTVAPRQSDDDEFKNSITR